MNVAILISGHMRTFRVCLPNLHWFVFRHFPGAAFFVSTVQDEDAESAELLRDKYPGQVVEIETVPEQPLLPMPPGVPLEVGWQRGQPFTHEPFAISVPPQAVLRQLWQLERVWRLFRTWRGNGDVDVVIRCRPDLWFHGAKYPKYPKLHDAFTPWWGRFGGVNDRFAVLGRYAAVQYFTTSSKVPALIERGCPLHPESLVAASLEHGGASISDRLKVEFSTIRKDGARPPEISGIDIAHAGLR